MYTQELINKIVSDRELRNRSKEDSDSQRKREDDKSEMLAGMLDVIVEEITKSTGKVRVVNFPSVQKIDDAKLRGKVDDVVSSINSLAKTVEESKYGGTDVQEISGSVTVANMPEIPEVKIPEFPKQIKADIASLPKYVADKLDDIRRAVSAIQVSPVVHVPEQKEPIVNVDIEGILIGLSAVEARINQLCSKPDPDPIDLNGLIEAVKKVESSVDNIQFPIPSFHSSYQQSIDMRAADAPKSYVYTTVAGKKCISSITATIGGISYRKSFTYTSSDPNNPDAESGWQEV